MHIRSYYFVKEICLKMNIEFEFLYHLQKKMKNENCQGHPISNLLGAVASQNGS